MNSQLIAILEQLGFVRIGQLTYGLVAEIWWSAQRRQELVVTDLGPSCWLKGLKRYLIVGKESGGLIAQLETRQRHLRELASYLESHFAEARLSLLFFDTITTELSPVYASLLQDKGELDRVRQSMSVMRNQVKEVRAATQIAQESRSLLAAEESQLVTQLTELNQRQAQLSSQLNEAEALQEHFLRNARATVLVFTVATPLYPIATDDTAKMMREIQNCIHHLDSKHTQEVKQKLTTGHLQIHLRELDYPLLAYAIEYSFLFSPKEIANFG
ncbi:hypothetical protein HYR54_15225 [Candidatus Acetothermia bacterium]|nr:hypothetical protein [Candidatus Acetothermia bacterium]